jgi:hypothetical protein
MSRDSSSKSTTRPSKKQAESVLFYGARYCWPDEFRDTVLARLLELNKQRAEEEKRSGSAAEAKPKKAGKKSGRKKSDSEKDSPGLY